MSVRLALVAAGGLALGMAALPAQATLFSFASDVNSNAFTFAGTAGAGGSFTMTDFSRPNTFTLLVDDNDGPFGTISIPVEFHANLTLTGGVATPLGGSLFLHSYRVTGTFGFYGPMGGAILECTVGPSSGIFTVPGTANTWATTGAVLGSDSFADVSYTGTAMLISALGGAANAANYGISVGPNGLGTSNLSNDFAFDLTVINSGAIGALVGIDPITQLPLTNWRSESSFSGSAAVGVPAPGVCGLIGAGMMVLARRRTRN